MPFPGLGIWLGLYLAVSAAEYLLLALSLQRLRSSDRSVPPEFAGVLDEETLSRSRRYTGDKLRWALAASAYQQAVAITFFFAGGLRVYQAWVSGWRAPFILQGVGFGLLLLTGYALLQAPFELLRVFRLEHAYGFTTQTFRQWWADFLKEQLVGWLLGGALLAGVLGLVRAFPQRWWLWVWAFYLAFTLFAMIISPYVLEPLFNRFTPVAEPLAGAVRDLARRAGIRVDQVRQMDASRRSRHSNAYFSGLGPVKRIVLYDTLLAKMDTDEVVAVLAHEAGHWRLHHIWKRLAASACLSLAVCYVGFVVLSRGALAAPFDLPDGSFLAQAALLLFLGSFLGYPFLPLLNGWSRRQERAADRFACRLLGTGAALRRALVKLSLDNLSDLSPHPWNVAVHYSHPPVLERLHTLEK